MRRQIVQLPSTQHIVCACVLATRCRITVMAGRFISHPAKCKRSNPPLPCRSRVFGSAARSGGVGGRWGGMGAFEVSVVLKGGRDRTQTQHSAGCVEPTTKLESSTARALQRKGRPGAHPPGCPLVRHRVIAPLQVAIRRYRRADLVLDDILDLVGETVGDLLVEQDVSLFADGVRRR